MPFLINPYISFPAVGGCSGSIISLSGLTAYYKLDGDATDSSGNGLDCTNTNVVFTTADPKYDECGIWLTGSTDSSSADRKLVYSTTEVIDTNSSNSSGWTVSMWLKFDNLPVGPPTTFLSFSSNGDMNYNCQYNPTLGWRIITDNGSTSNSNAWANTPSTDTWYHVAIVHDASAATFKVYIDGTERISGSSVADGDAGFGDNLTIGNYPNTFIRTFLGEIDDVAIFARKLSTTEIDTIVASECPINT